MVSAIILARMSSRRLPGKVLRDLAGKPMLERVVERARCIEAADEIVVATSSDTSDDPIARYCQRLGLPVFRGELLNVARRVLDCAQARGSRYFARINADSPFLDANLIDGGLTRAVAKRLDVVTNLQPRSFPHGVTVEVFSTETYQAAYKRMTEPGDFEHVTAFFYRHLEDFRFANLTMAGWDCCDVRLTVDDPESLAMASSLIEYLGEEYESADVHQVVAAYRGLFPNAAALRLGAIA